MEKRPSEALEREEELQVEEESEESEALVAYDIASYPSDLTLWGLKEQLAAGDIVIPEFQRNYVWKLTQASLLIESFLLGLPVPQVFFYVDDENKFLVIDGQQRILSAAYFFEGYFGDENTQGKRQIFRLTGLNEKSRFANKRFEDLTETDQRKLKGAVLRAINIRQLSPKSENTSVYHIFERLNTGGTPLKPQEIRNCVFIGDFVGVLRDLNKGTAWRGIVGKTTLDKHQKDVELILRVFALSDGGRDTYEKPMKEFLSTSMSNHRNGVTKKVVHFKKAFQVATQIIVSTIGKKPFHIRGPLNSSVLDSVLATTIDHIKSIPADFAARYAKLTKDDEFLNATYYGTSDVAVLEKRFERAEKILFS